MTKGQIVAVLSATERSRSSSSFLNAVEFRQWSCQSYVGHAEKDDHNQELQLNGGGVDFCKHIGAE